MTHLIAYLLLAAVIVTGVTVLTIASRVVGTVSLIAASFVDVPEIPLGSAHLRAGELASLGLFLGVLIVGRRAGLKHLVQAITRVPLFWPMLAYLGVNVLSIAFSPLFVRSIELNLILASFVLGYIAIVSVDVDQSGVNNLVRFFVAAAFVEAIVGLALLILAAESHRVIFGIQLDPDTGFFGARGTTADANYFGSFLITPLLILVTVLLLLPSRRLRKTIAVTFAILVLGAGIVSSLSRGAWGALPFGGIVYAILVVASRGTIQALGPRRFWTRTLALAGAILVGVTIIVVGNFGAGHKANSGQYAVVSRVLQGFDYTRPTSSLYGRVQSGRLALDDWRISPWFGTGTGSFNKRLPGDTNPNQPGVLNVFLLALHDTGIVGLGVFIWLLASYFAFLARSRSRARTVEDRLLLTSFLAGSVALLVAFQFSPGFLQSFPWVMMGLSVLAGRVAGKAESHVNVIGDVEPTASQPTSASPDIDPMRIANFESAQLSAQPGG